MAISSLEFDYIRSLVHERSAIVLEAGKEYLVESRLAPLVRREGIASIEGLVARLRAQQFNGLHLEVIEALTINETLFFRDAHPFEALRQTVLPALIERRRAERRLTIWSAACSSGQEPYSVAMILRELSYVLDGWTITMLGSDLSRGMLARAREGQYSQLEINRGMPSSGVCRHFMRRGDGWQIRDDIRRMVEFREINLSSAWPSMPSWDLVLLRNVMIYFDRETRRSVLHKVGRLLRPDGYLMLGCSETTTGLDSSFYPEQINGATCYRPGPRPAGA